MKTKILSGAVMLLAGSLLAADTNAPAGAAKDEVAAAAKALAEKANYSWSSIVVVPANSQFRPGPTTGQTEKGGYTHVTMSFGGNTSEIFIKGDKGAMSSADNGWQSLADMDADESGPGRFMGAMIRNYKTPAVTAEEVIGGIQMIKKDGDAYTGDLTEDEAKTLLSLRPRGGNAPTITDAKGSAKFWIKDGMLSKSEIHVTGKVSFNGNDRDVDRDSTVEIKDVNTTKVVVPDDALKKLNEAAPAPADTKVKS